MGEITVTMPLKEYERMKRVAKERDVSNFLSVEYSDFVKNQGKVVINQEAVENAFGKRVEDYSVNINEMNKDNMKMFALLKDISEIPITRGISPVEQTLQRIVNKANHAITELFTGTTLFDYQKDFLNALKKDISINGADYNIRKGVSTDGSIRHKSELKVQEESISIKID